jgi:hypothetical protein
MQAGTFKVELIHPALKIRCQLFSLKMPALQPGEFIQIN